MSVIMCVVLGVSVCGAAVAYAVYNSETNYMSIMMDAAVAGDYNTGRWAESARNEKIDSEGLPYNKVSYDDLVILARVIKAEAGSSWLSDEWKMCVGEVVLNRVASPEFPNTIYDVVRAPGQYPWAAASSFAYLIPDARSIEIARRLLEGERYLNDASVVFQANFRQGSGVHTKFYDYTYGWTYFCISSRPYLYYT